jgi:hypothetical protein
MYFTDKDIHVSYYYANVYTYFTTKDIYVLSTIHTRCDSVEQVARDRSRLMM